MSSGARIMPCWEEILTIRPRTSGSPSAGGVCANICCTARLQPKNTPLALTAMTRSQSASLVSSKGPPARVAALLTITSNRPQRATVAVTARSISAHTATSPGSKAASAPISAKTSRVGGPPSRGVWVTSTNITLAPSAANFRAMALPMPPPPPVINATRLCKRMSLLSALSGLPITARKYPRQASAAC